MSRILGWHNLSNELLLFHAQIKQFLQEPAKEIDRMKQEAVSMKRFIEEVIDFEDKTGGEGTDENGGLEQGDGIPQTY